MSRRFTDGFLQAFHVPRLRSGLRRRRSRGPQARRDHGLHREDGLPGRAGAPHRGCRDGRPDRR
ncbi:MAG: hypothetical protein B7Z15_20755, partial [Rhizobiales bacterium 32-66-8]